MQRMQVPRLRPKIVSFSWLAPFWYVIDWVDMDLNIIHLSIKVEHDYFAHDFFTPKVRRRA